MSPFVSIFLYGQFLMYRVELKVTGGSVWRNTTMFLMYRVELKVIKINKPKYYKECS